MCVEVSKGLSHSNEVTHFHLVFQPFSVNKFYYSDLETEFFIEWFLLLCVLFCTLSLFLSFDYSTILNL